MLSANIQTNHAELGEHISVFNPNLDAAGFVPAILTTPFGAEQAAQLDGLINLQSSMIAYLDDFKLMFLITLCAAPLLLMLRYKPMAPGAGGAPVPAVHAD
jgi:DHA2 family multidrug resistance protein